MTSDSTSHGSTGLEGSTLWSVDLSGSAGQKAKRFVRSVPGSAGTKNLERLKALFTDESDPSPVAIYRAYHGDVEFDRPADARTSNSGTSKRFDPADDPAPTTDKVRVRRAYEAAADAGMDETAEFLRTATFAHQRRLASLLFNEFIDSDDDR